MTVQTVGEAPPPTEHSGVGRELFVRQLVAIQMAGQDPPESVVQQLLAGARDVHFREREVLYEGGESPEWFYMIRTGEVELTLEGAESWFFDGGAVGVLDALIGRPHERTAIAVRPTLALALHTSDYFAMLEDNIYFSHQILAYQAARLHELHRELPEKASRFSRPADWRLVRKDARELGMVERLLVLRKVPAFGTSSIQALVALAEGGRTELIEEGQVLFRQGEETKHFWVIASGRVAIERDGTEEAIRGPGELIESYAAFGHQERQYTAVAKTPLLMLTIDEDDLFDRMEEHFELTRSVMAYLARQWEEINRARATAGAAAVQGRG